LFVEVSRIIKDKQSIFRSSLLALPQKLLTNFNYLALTIADSIAILETHQILLT